MGTIADFFVQNPAGISLVAVVFLVAYLLLRRSSSVARPGALLWPALAWALWAAWEFAVVRFTPEANIRVDLILIIPIVVIVSVAGVVMLFINRKPATAS